MAHLPIHPSELVPPPNFRRVRDIANDIMSAKNRSALAEERRKRIAAEELARHFQCEAQRADFEKLKTEAKLHEQEQIIDRYKASEFARAQDGVLKTFSPDLPGFVAHLEEIVAEINLKPISTGPNSRTMAKRMLFLVEEWFSFEAGSIISPRRACELIPPRRLFCQLMYKYSSWSLPQIGRLINRDHTTVLYHTRAEPVAIPKNRITKRGQL